LTPRLWLKSRIPAGVLKTLTVIAVMGVVELLTHEPAAVAGAFGTTVAALHYRRPSKESSPRPSASRG
jgi:hypothetical protein